jgi:hypothetical protein
MHFYKSQIWNKRRLTFDMLLAKQNSDTWEKLFAITAGGHFNYRLP